MKKIAKQLAWLLFLAEVVLFSSSDIVTKRMVQYEVNDTSFTVTWRVETAPIDPAVKPNTYEYQMDVYDITSGLIEKIQTISPVSYTPPSMVDEVIVW